MVNSDQRQQEPFPLELFKEIHAQSCKLNSPPQMIDYAAILCVSVGGVVKQLMSFETMLPLHDERLQQDAILASDYLKSSCIHLCAWLVDLHQLTSDCITFNIQHESSPDR